MRDSAVPVATTTLERSSDVLVDATRRLALVGGGGGDAGHLGAFTAALASPGAAPRARAPGRRRRRRTCSVSLEPTPTSAARATSSSSLAWLESQPVGGGRRQLLEAVGRGQLAVDRGQGLVDAGRRIRSWPGRSARPGATATGSGRGACTAASISSPRLAICQPWARPASRRSAMLCRRSRSGPLGVERTVAMQLLARALGVADEVPPRLADGERVDGRDLRRPGHRQRHRGEVHADTDGDGGDDRHAEQGGADTARGAEQDPPRQDGPPRPRREEPVAEGPHRPEGYWRAPFCPDHRARSGHIVRTGRGSDDGGGVAVGSAHRHGHPLALLRAIGPCTEGGEGGGAARLGDEAQPVPDRPLGRP